MKKIYPLTLFIILLCAESFAQVGINTTTPNSTLHIAGALSLPIKTVTGAYTVTDLDFTIIAIAVPGERITLPPATYKTGRIYVIYLGSTTSVIVDATASGQFLRMGSTSNTWTLVKTPTKYSATAWSGMTVQSNGTNWAIIGLSL
jgi:hypothetical protein